MLKLYKMFSVLKIQNEQYSIIDNNTEKSKFQECVFSEMSNNNVEYELVAYYKLLKKQLPGKYVLQTDTKIILYNVEHNIFDETDKLAIKIVCEYHLIPNNIKPSKQTKNSLSDRPLFEKQFEIINLADDDTELSLTKSNNHFSNCNNQYAPIYSKYNDAGIYNLDNLYGDNRCQSITKSSEGCILDCNSDNARNIKNYDIRDCNFQPSTTNNFTKCPPVTDEGYLDYNSQKNDYEQLKNCNFNDKFGSEEYDFNPDESIKFTMLNNIDNHFFDNSYLNYNNDNNNDDNNNDEYNNQYIEENSQKPKISQNIKILHNKPRFTSTMNKPFKPLTRLSNKPVLKNKSSDNFVTKTEEFNENSDEMC